MLLVIRLLSIVYINEVQWKFDLDSNGWKYISAFLLQKAMEDLGFSHEEIIDIFRIISAVLKLSNINFIPTTNMDGTDGCAISNDYGKFCIILVRGFFFFPLLINT